MEGIQDIITTGNGYLDTAILAVSAALTWISKRFQAWKAIESKPLKAAIAVGLFMALAITLSHITALFT